MSDVTNPTTPLSLPQSAVDSLKSNIDQANTLLDAWSSLEKLGIALPGSKEQLQTVRDMSQKLIDLYGPKQ